MHADQVFFLFSFLKVGIGNLVSINFSNILLANPAERSWVLLTVIYYYYYLRLSSFASLARENNSNLPRPTFQTKVTLFLSRLSITVYYNRRDSGHYFC